VQLNLTPVSGRLGDAVFLDDTQPLTGFVLIDTLLWGEAGDFKDAVMHMILPAIVLGTIPLAVIVRMTRSSMLEVLGEDYIRTARAKGLTRMRVIVVHALRNAMLPVVTVIGLQIGTLLVGCLVVLLSLILGVILGLLAGYVGGALDAAIMRLVDIMLALPSLLLALVLVAIFGPSIVNASLALTFVALPHYIRLTRAAVLVEVNRDYVTASSVAGAGALRQMFVNILPNCLAPLIVQASLGFSNAILDMAALGFLGMGAQPPTPEWGTMLSDVLQYAQSAWWVVTFPGLVILLTVLAFNLMGDGLRDALDPKLKQ